MPVFDERGSSFSDFEQRATLQIRTTKAEPASRAPLLVLHMHSAHDKLGSLQVGNRGGFAQIPEKLRGYFAPDAVDATPQQVIWFTHYRRTDVSIAENIAEFDPSRRPAESKLEMGAGFPGQLSRHCA